MLAFQPGINVVCMCHEPWVYKKTAFPHITQAPLTRHSPVALPPRFVLISRAFPSCRLLATDLKETWFLLASGSIFTWLSDSFLSHGNSVSVRRHTISNAPLITPQSTFENQSPPSRASDGNSANSANGFSSKVRMNSEDWARLFVGCWVGGGKETVGVMARKLRKATCSSVFYEFSLRIEMIREMRGRTYFRDHFSGLAK